MAGGNVPAGLSMIRLRSFSFHRFRTIARSVLCLAQAPVTGLFRIGLGGQADARGYAVTDVDS